MFFPNPALQAPTRITFEEAWSVRRSCSIAEMRKEVRRRRLEHIPDVMNGRRAAWALVITAHALRQFIEDGHLPADLVENRYGKQHFEIAAPDLIALAEELA
jgi:hypothetical protein